MLVDGVDGGGVMGCRVDDARVLIPPLLTITRMLFSEGPLLPLRSCERMIPPLVLVLSVWNVRVALRRRAPKLSTASTRQK